MVECMLGCMPVLVLFLFLFLFLFIVDEFLLQKVLLAKVLHRFNISYTAVSHSAFCTPFGGPASSLFPMVHRSGTSRSATLHRRPAQKQLRSGGPASCVFLMVLLPAFPPRRPGQQHLPGSSLPQCRHPLRHSAPASNKPHLAEKISGLASNLAHLGRIC